MIKFLKLNLNSLEVSIKLSNFIILQRMSNPSNLIIVQRISNSNTNTPAYCAENKNVISDNVIKQGTGITNFVESNDNQRENIYPPGTTNQFYNYNHSFNNQLLNVPEFFWYNQNYFHLPQQNYYSGAPIYCRNPSPLLTNTRNFHITHSDQNNRGRFLKRIGMDITALRNWQNVQVRPSSKPGFIFTIMSFNVLAQDLLEIHPYLYHSHDTKSLIWENRWNNIFKEISQLQPDILCLQEVQYSHIHEYYSRLETLGFTGIFKKKTGDRTDGCALYYKTDKLQMVEHKLVNFFQPTVSLLDRHNVGIVAKFVPKLHPTREFVVATTHLLYNPRRDDVRLAQMQLLLTDIEKMSYKDDNGKPSYLPMIVTGDLNSDPYSNLYEYVTKGEIKYENLAPALLYNHAETNKQLLVTSSLGITDNSQYLEVIEKRTSNENVVIDVDQIEECPQKSDFKELKEPKLQKSKDYKMRTLSHNFKFKSVYEHGSEENNGVTTFQDKWVTVDYIFYSEDKFENRTGSKLQLLSRYRLPTREEFNGIRIPNYVMGSDHLSLIAKFKLEF
ncbi:protein angel homolog 2 isoform X1 [Diorhabda carinulata]|uniref:protein angel homolog 2 isoform X1 n=1 Tax=Diorhabda carinulata TaxID=1163345 RepID=UPI0025A2A262|nr:protein angel homolog 2 isoform X1 [Diorhabda carinulata]